MADICTTHRELWSEVLDLQPLAATDLTADGLPEHLRPVVRHLQACAACAAEWNLLRAGIGQLHAMPSLPLPEGWEDRLRSALHGEGAPSMHVTVGPPSPRRRGWHERLRSALRVPTLAWAGGSVAAALLVVLALQQPTAPPPRMADEQVTVAEQPATGDPANGERKAASARTLRSKPQRAPADALKPPAIPGLPPPQQPAGSAMAPRSPAPATAPPLQQVPAALRAARDNRAMTPPAGVESGQSGGALPPLRRGGPPAATMVPTPKKDGSTTTAVRLGPRGDTGSSGTALPKLQIAARWQPVRVQAVNVTETPLADAASDSNSAATTMRSAPMAAPAPRAAEDAQFSEVTPSREDDQRPQDSAVAKSAPAVRRRAPGATAGPAGPAGPSSLAADSVEPEAADNLAASAGRTAGSTAASAAGSARVTTREERAAAGASGSPVRRATEVTVSGTLEIIAPASRQPLALEIRPSPGLWPVASLPGWKGQLATARKIRLPVSFRFQGGGPHHVQVLLRQQNGKVIGRYQLPVPSGPTEPRPASP